MAQVVDEHILPLHSICQGYGIRGRDICRTISLYDEHAPYYIVEMYVASQKEIVKCSLEDSDIDWVYMPTSHTAAWSSYVRPDQGTCDDRKFYHDRAKDMEEILLEMKTKLAVDWLTDAGKPELLTDD